MGLLLPFFPWWLELITFMTLFFILLKRYMTQKSQREAVLLWLPEERCYLDPNHNNQRVEFPSVKEAPSVYLSVIFPAYNEEDRITNTLNESIDYLKTRQNRDPEFTWEILVVDDGSRDSTSNLVLESFVKKEGVNHIRLLKLLQNRGKGGAIRRGILCARGRYLLMADADGATKFSDIEKLEKKLKELITFNQPEVGVAVGSRAHLQKTQAVSRSPIRKFVSWVFHILVDFVCLSGVKDTQCGFKLFTRKTAHLLFQRLHIERWAFDVELLYLAKTLNQPIVEVPITWHEVEGSKLSPYWDSIFMAKDTVKIRLMYVLGFWSPPVDQQLDNLEHEA